jgi:ubiquinone/menaquinone biosynthesis C-methylase UbiE
MKDENKRTLFKNFIEEYQEYFKDIDELWFNNFKNLKSFINLNKKLPSSRSKNEEEKYLGKWLEHQKYNYKNNKTAMKDEDKRTLFQDLLEEYKEYLKNNNESISETSSIKEDLVNEESDEEEEIIIKLNKPEKKQIKNMDLNKGSILKSSKTNSKKSKKERVKTEISILHQRYKTLSSNNLHNEFKNDEKLWINYHKIAEENEKTFPENEIPRNKIIQELEKIKTKRTKKIVDMGCGKAFISKHFDNDIRFEFINYDHISINDKIISCDISKLPLEDDSIEICILCLSMWGSNCKEYIKEAERVLESNGKLYIIEPTKRWSSTDENGLITQEAKKLREIIEENRFQIIKEEIKKFVLFECIKN